MSDKNKTYCLINYGCQMNESDTEHYAGQLQELGYAPNPDFHTADIIIVNTCCVRESAEKKIAGKIGELKAVKRANPDVVICVAGCMAQKDGEKLRKKHPQVDLLLGTAYVNDFKRLLLEFLAERKAAVYTDLTIHQSEFEGHMVRQSSFAAWIPIMYGCNNFCTYCIVPYARGRERSRRGEDVLSEVRGLVESGYRDITLLGQNVNSYSGSDDFAALLHKCASMGGEYRVRFMTSHPKDASSRLVDVIANDENVAKHFHLPVQSGSNRILGLMNRRYTREQYIEKALEIKEKVPGVSLTTDIICGFPTETDEDFEQTLSLVKQVGFDMIYTFIYSRRVGTVADKMEGQIPRDISNQRFKALSELENGIAEELNARFIGETVRVLSDGLNKNGIPCGRSTQNKIVTFDKPVPAGEFADVIIDTAGGYALAGRIKEQ